MSPILILGYEVASKEYGVLQKNIKALKVQFLNFEKRIDGKYTFYELTQCRAFITFSHAEVEIYFEAMASKAIDAAEKKWRQNERVTNSIAAMLTYRPQKDSTIPDNPIDQGKQSKFSSLVGSAIASQRAAIKGNHGIKPKNLAELFIPLGMASDQFDGALLIQLKNFGERRGNHVHQNSQVSLPKVRDPFDDELHDIEFLVSEIETFDLLAAKIK